MSFQRNLDPLRMNNKELMLSHAAKVSDHCDIFEVPESHVDIIQTLQKTHKNKSFLVKVSSLDNDNINNLVAAGVNMISFVASGEEDFDFTKFESVKFVADITNVYEKNSYNPKKITTVASTYLNKHVKIFNLNINSNDDIERVAPLVALQSIGATVSVHVKANNDSVDKLVENKVDTVALIETTPDIEICHVLSNKLEEQNNCGLKLDDEIEK